MRRGFTLIEVLIVIAIVAVVLSLLVPAVGRAREAGRASVCSSNVRQLLIATDLYSADFGDLYPPGMPDRLANLTRWHGSRALESQAFRPEGGPLSGYLGSGGVEGGVGSVRSCPTFAHVAARLAATGTGFERSCGAYGYNNAFVGTRRTRTADGAWAFASDLSGSPRSLFASPGATAVFADSALADGNAAAGIIEYSFIEPRFWPDAPLPPAGGSGSRTDPSIHFRHAGGRGAGGATSVAWLDGHVGPERMTHSWSSGVYPAVASEHGIGWFGPNDDNGLFDP